MPYTIRKTNCKRSDGTSGKYVLSYKDKKGKKHRACHTSKKKAKGQIAAIEMESLIRSTISDIIKEELNIAKDDTMQIKLSHLRRIIRETIEEMKLQSVPSRPDSNDDIDEADVDESEFTYAIAKAADKGQKQVDIDGEKFPVKMSKEKAADILNNDKKRNRFKNNVR